MRVLYLPLVCTSVFLGLSFLPRVQANSHLVWSFWGFGSGLLVWLALLYLMALRKGTHLRAQIVLKNPHYIQALVQLSIYIYWGLYWREVANHAWLIVAQILFAYALDMLVCWSRRHVWHLGFGQFPIILSTNFFIWFRDDWFYFQFLMVAVGVLGKEFVQWTQEGRRVHIFNPSALSLAVLSLGLILTGRTDITWGQQIAETLLAPTHIYVVIFLAGLVVQAFFSVTPMTLAAAATLLALSASYKGMTGVYFFGDSTIPIAVFLGLHLLVTDPSTSPRTHGGRLLFGGLYGLGAFALFAAFSALGVPTFYDKLLPVPVLNLTIKVIDAAVRADIWKTAKAKIAVLALRPLRMNFVLMGLWTALFVGMYLSGDVGSDHEGRRISFWRQACAKDLPHGCEHLVRILSYHTAKAKKGSGAARHELGVLLREGRGAQRDLFTAISLFQQACALGYSRGCESFSQMDQWSAEHLDELRNACRAGDASTCAYLGFLYLAGKVVPRDEDKAIELFQKACDLGLRKACDFLKDQGKAKKKAPSPGQSPGT